MSGIPGSRMSCVDSVTHDGSIADLKDIDTDEIKIFDYYKFKDPSHVSNNLEIAKYRNKVNS